MKGMEHFKIRWAVVVPVWALLCLLSTGAWGQNLSKPADEMEKVAQDPGAGPKIGLALRERSGINVVPLVFYTPETDFGGAVGAHYFFRWPGESVDDRASSVMLLALGTFNRIWLVSLLPKLRWNNAAWQLDSDISFGEFFGRFWGIGPDTPDSNEETYRSFVFHGEIEAARALFENFYVGVFYKYEKQKLKETEEGGLLASGRYTPSNNYDAAGVGLILRWDNRDNEYAPRKGTYLEWSSGLFDKVVGSDSHFTEHILDARQFIGLGGKHVLAFQGYLSIVTDDPPYSRASWLGGQGLLRGFYQGRYRDRNMIVVQGEYRFPIYWRFSGVAFAGMGDVSHTPQSFNFDEFKFAYGLGLRFVLNRQERIRMRFDVGVAQGVPAAYLVFGEAF